MEKYDVFISYSRKDTEIADRIEQELKKYDISYFIDRTDINLGEDFAKKIAECIYNCNILLFVWSENSNQSKNTANEIALAIEFEKTIVPFKIGKFKPDFNLAYNLVRFNRIDAVEFNEAQICSMASKLAAQLGKSKRSEAPRQEQSSQDDSSVVKDTSASDTVLKILTDTECRVSVDYEEKGIARPRQIMRIPLCAGSYCLLFESTEDKDNSIEEIGYKISEHTQPLYQVRLKDNALRTNDTSTTEKTEAHAAASSEPEMSAEEMYAKGIQYYFGKDVRQDFKKCVYWLRKASEQGHVEAINMLVHCFYKGFGVKTDWLIGDRLNAAVSVANEGDTQRAIEMVKEALKSAKDIIERDLTPEEMYNEGEKFYNGFVEVKNFKKAVQWYQKAAEQGYADAIWSLGVCYENGEGLPQDYTKAVQWYQKAVDKGHIDAMYDLGVCYENGTGVARDYEHAASLYLKSADGGNVEAMCRLGDCYKEGRGVEQDYERAMNWYGNAADEQYAAGFYNIGKLYEEGLGVDQDYEEAAECYRKAAKDFYPDALYALAVCYEEGRGVEQDDRQAAYWYKNAAEEGNTDAMFNIGGLYEDGEGIEQDYSKAVYWYGKASEQGYGSAMYNLSRCYENGLGVTKNQDIADKLFEAGKVAGDGDKQRAIEMVNEALNQ